MTTLSGSLHSCGTGTFSTSITCTGSTCGKLENIPGITCTNASSTSMTCTNNIACNGPSAVISSFSMQQKGLSISQAHNVAIGNQTFTLTSTGGTNFTATNTTQGTATTTPGSAGFSFRRESHAKLVMLVVFLLCTAQAFAQPSRSPLQGINS